MAIIKEGELPLKKAPFQHHGNDAPLNTCEHPVQPCRNALLAAGQTHIGLVRSSNQDAFLIDAESGFFIVADGMGGYSGGEVASQMAIDVTSRFLQMRSMRSDEKAKCDSDENPKIILEGAFAEANRTVYRASRKNPSLAGMGTTLIVAWIKGRTCHVAHAGDVRGYLFRESALQQLTHDHSTVAGLVERGQLTPEEARDHPLRHQIERAVGPFPEVEADITTVELRENDLILLCTDGLWDMVYDKEIVSVLNGYKNVRTACATLIEHALSNGGKDNVTVVIVEIL